MPEATPDWTAFDEAVQNFTSWHRGNTRASYSDDMRIFGRWCRSTGTDPFTVNRLGVEAFLVYCEEERGNSLRTLKRRLSVMKRFYALLADDRVIDRSPAQLARIRRRYRDDDQNDVINTGLSRYEMAGLLRAGIASRPCDAALVALMGGMGLRVSEACGLDVPNVLYREEEHRVLRFLGKGNQLAVLPIPPQLWRPINDAVAGRTEGPLLSRPNKHGERMNPPAATRVIARLAKKAGIERRVTPHDLRRGFVSGLFDSGATLRQAQTAARHFDPRMTLLYDRRRLSLDQSPNYAYAAWLASAAS